MVMLISLMSMPLAVLAQERESEGLVDPFAFRTPSAFGTAQTNVDPFAYRGEPVKFGTFLVWPNLSLQQGYNDNVLATESSTEDDFVTVIKPELIIRKNIRRHDFVASFNSEVLRHADLSDENVENYTAQFRGNIEAKKGLNIPIEIEYRDGHLKRRDQTRANLADLTIKPLRNQSAEVETGLIYKPNRLLLSFLGKYRQGRLKNGELQNGDTVIRDNRDVNITQGQARVAYDISETLSPFLETTYAQEDYINEAVGAVTRNNDLFRVLAGSSFNYRGLLSGFLGVGWENRNFESALVEDTDSISVDGNIIWNPRVKTQIAADVSRETLEDNILFSGLTQTSLGLDFRHELYKDTFLRSHLSYELKDFEDISREDVTYDTGLGILYIINPNLQIGADYNYVYRDSTVSGLDLKNNIFFIRVRTPL